MVTAWCWVAPKYSKAATTIAKNFDLAGLLGEGRLAMANVDLVPAGKYGKAALTTLGVWPSVEKKLAQAENVRAALLLVSTGEAPLGIVYKTDAAADPKVKIIGTFSEDTHEPIVYPAALIAASNNAAAGDFLKYLRSEQGKAAIEGAGLYGACACHVELTSIGRLFAWGSTVASCWRALAAVIGTPFFIALLREAHRSWS